MTIRDVKVGDVLIQMRQGVRIETTVIEIGPGPNGSLRVVLAHPSLTSVGVDGQTAIFWPANKMDMELPRGMVKGQSTTRNAL